MKVSLLIKELHWKLDKQLFGCLNVLQGLVMHFYGTEFDKSEPGELVGGKFCFHEYCAS